MNFFFAASLTQSSYNYFGKNDRTLSHLNTKLVLKVNFRRIFRTRSEKINMEKVDLELEKVIMFSVSVGCELVYTIRLSNHTLLERA